MKYDFMRAHTDEFSLTGMCRVLSVSRSGYYGWCARGSSARQQERGQVYLLCFFHP